MPYILPKALQRRAESAKGGNVLMELMEHNFPYRGDGRGVYKANAARALFSAAFTDNYYPRMNCSS